MNQEGRVAYVCGPLTELSSQAQQSARVFYTRIADVCQRILGVRAFVPHEHYDPIRHPHAAPCEVDVFERQQICEWTSYLIVVPIAPSWGGGIEVEIAHQSGVPIVLLCDSDRLRGGKIPRLFRGNPGVRVILSYSDENDALSQLASVLKERL